MYTNVDLLFSLLGLLAWIALIFFWFRAAFRFFRGTPLALILGVLSTIALLDDFIIELVEPLDLFFRYLLRGENQYDIVGQNILIELVLSPLLWKNSIICLFTFTVITWLFQITVGIFKLDRAKKGNKIAFIQNAVTIVIILVAVYLSLAALITLPVVTSGIENNSQLSQNQYELVSDTVQRSHLVIELENDIERLRLANSLTDSTAGWSIILDGFTTGNEEVYSDRVNKYMSLYFSEIKKANIADPILDLFYAEASYLFREIENIDLRSLPLAKAKALATLSQAEERNLELLTTFAYKAELYNWFASIYRLYWSHANQKIGLLDKFYYDVVDKTEHADYTQTAYEYFLAKEQLDIRFVEPPFPQLPNQGDHLGVVVKTINWLVKIESYSLVVVVGLVGFGLLGAVGAGFIREKKEQSKAGELLVPELTKALIGGLSAALVVYLGVQGSVSLLSGNNSSSGNNGYLLYFLALLAAIYSDTAWDWAKRRFEKTLEDNQTA